MTALLMFGGFALLLILGVPIALSLGVSTMAAIAGSPDITVSINTVAQRIFGGLDSTFHTSRHTFATMMLTLGADLYTTSKLLGHADVKMTQVYAKIINQKKDDAVNLVNGLFD